MYLAKKRRLYYVFYTDPATNKKTSISTGESSKKTAQKFLNVFRMQTEHKGIVISTPTLESAVRSYRMQCEPYHTEKTRIDMKGTFDRFIRYCGNKPVTEVPSQLIRRYIESRLEVSSYAANKDLRYLKTFFKYLYESEYLNTNPTDRLKKFPTPDQIPLFFGEDEFSKLLSVIDNEDLRDIIVFAVYTGLRRGGINQSHLEPYQHKGSGYFAE